ncbi:MAG: UDP-4-amino-4,6-dideoxy-N-acetyl-beta-L-altrosamine transaminase [Hungatella sp.]|jgi:UDP-4-amino-4,6-dideoxy-N-acetyl-beta-L-altrosamine transaminase|nr:UDP-4-amino-4,6-dideoxy-N-acetyl-beta-L-altrosamine transaminase [Hungatella sp.]
METIAINGGEPVRKTKIYYGHQLIEEDDIRVVAKVLRSEYLTCGPAVEQMEQKLAAYTGAKYAVAVSNGTAALHCACMAAGIKKGDEVITTPLTFAASANCVLYCGGRPVFADIDPETYNIDPKSIEACITEKTKAVIAVDFTGQVVKAREIRAICDKYKLIFIEDAAHSIGTRYEDRMVGTLADMTTFSFHPVKTITAGEGGAVLTDNEELYKKLVLAHAHGITHDENLMERSSYEGPWYYEEVALGYNYRLTDFQAALLMNQLGKIDRFIARRREIVKIYDEALKRVSGIILQKEIKESASCKHLYVIRLDPNKLTCTRRQFFNAMSAENIQCQVHYIPVYWFSYYEQLGYEKGLCPIAEKIYKGIMSIPLYPAMSDQDVQDVIHGINKIAKYYAR